MDGLRKCRNGEEARVFRDEELQEGWKKKHTNPFYEIKIVLASTKFLHILYHQTNPNDIISLQTEGQALENELEQNCLLRTAKGSRQRRITKYDMYRLP